MTDSTNDHRHAVALFRYGVIADLVRIKPGSAQGLYGAITEKAALDYTIPGSTRTRIAPETIRHWLKRYRQGGFDALLPKPRADRGRARAIPDDIADALIDIKEHHPRFSVPMVIQHARSAHPVPPHIVLAPSTVHRLLSREGLMRKSAGEPTTLDRRRFAFARAGELWMSDVMHGPSVTVDGRKKRKTFLIAFIDDATRVIPYAAFTTAESTHAFLPVFKQALLRRGIPQRLYVDNGANYRSHQLALVCAKLSIALIHARPYQPQGKGKQERWFRTARAQLLSRLVPEDTASLETLNRCLWAWAEGEYHHAPHRGLDGETPLERWARTGDAVRFPEPGLNLDELFLFELIRKVQKDRTVSLNGVVYEVDAALVGEKVMLRFDPSAPPGRPVQVWHDARRIHDAKPLDAYANAFVRRHRPSWTLQPDIPPPAPTPGLALRKLRDRDPHEQEN